MGTGSFAASQQTGCFTARVYNGIPHDVVIFSRKGCHLCDVIKQTITEAEGNADFQWRELDIDADPELRMQFDDKVPVVFIGGRKTFKLRMDKHQFLRALNGRV